MRTVACNCGATFHTIADIAECPVCHRGHVIVPRPVAPYVKAEMEAELRQLVADHQPQEEPQ